MMNRPFHAGGRGSVPAYAHVPASVLFLPLRAVDGAVLGEHKSPGKKGWDTTPPADYSARRAARLPPVRLWRGIAVALGAVALVLVAGAPLAIAAARVPESAAHSTLGGHRSRAPEPGPCLQNAARCGGTGSLVAPGATFGLTLFFCLGWAVVPAVASRLVRRSRSGSGALPDGSLAMVMRPPRVPSVAV